MHQNIIKVMIGNVSVSGEIGKWGQMHFTSCFFSKDAIPLVAIVDDYCEPVNSFPVFCFSP